METSPTMKVRRLSQQVTIVIFLALMWLPLLEAFLQWDRVAQVNEKRVLAAFPKLKPGCGGVQNYVAGLNQYFAEHFGFRERLIYWQQNWKRNWFKDESFYQVVIGPTGWLFNSSDDIVENFRATTPFPTERLRQWRTLLETRRDWLAKRGIHYIFTIAPCKHTIYPEFLPEWMRPVGSLARIDQFEDYMKTNSTVEVADLRQGLRDGKSKGKEYSVTDTHWNEYGAFVACEELVRKLSTQMPALSALPLAAFAVTYDTQPGGNLAMRLAATNSLLETNCPHLSPRLPLNTLSATRKNINGGIFMKVLNPKQKNRAIIFGDSFAEGWFPFIGYHFNQVDCYRLYDHSWRDKHGIFVETPGHVMDYAAIEREKPDVVIDEILEELFWQEDPATIMAEDGSDAN